MSNSVHSHGSHSGSGGKNSNSDKVRKAKTMKIGQIKADNKLAHSKMFLNDFFSEQSEDDHSSNENLFHGGNESLKPSISAMF